MSHPAHLASFLNGLRAVDHTAHDNATPAHSAGVAHVGADHLAGILNGSWFLQFLPSNPSMNALIRGPLRIDGAVTRPRISGDIYVGADGDGTEGAAAVETMPPGSLVIGENWYPAFAQRKYAWYFRGVDATVEGDELRAMIERHVWDPALSRFVQSDMGGLVMTLQPDPVAWPNLPKPAPIMRGEALIAGEIVQVLAIKTSEFYRGCIVEVDVMEYRSWPDEATDSLGTRTFTFDNVFRDAGLDFVTRISEVNIPDDNVLAPLELHNLLRDHREPTAMPDAWRLWLLVGSSWQANPGVLGIMFDTTKPHREGSVGFFDPRLSSISRIEASARGKCLGEVDLAFLRTLIHEAGHALNLFHPKADSHSVPTGTTIMNQTGDVIRFASATNPYPGNASMSFNDHNRASLIHGPDPQTKPGWLPFGWGHDSNVSTGIEEPIGIMGLNSGTIAMSELELDLDLPSEVHRGEVVVANLSLRNATDRDMEVSSALNLAEDDLEIVAIGPDARKRMPRDAVKICGSREAVTLTPGDTLENAVQLFFNNGDFTFSHTGTYEVWARFRPSADQRQVVESKRHKIHVRAPVTRKEQELETTMLDTDVGLSVAFGDFGADARVERLMKRVAENYKDTDTGALCAMVVSNSLSRPHRDIRTGEVCRDAQEDDAASVLKSALSRLSNRKAFRLAMATVTPRNAKAPLLDMMEGQIADDGGSGDAWMTMAMLKKLGMRA